MIWWCGFALNRVAVSVKSCCPTHSSSLNTRLLTYLLLSGPLARFISISNWNVNLRTENTSTDQSPTTWRFQYRHVVFTKCVCTACVFRGGVFRLHRSRLRCQLVADSSSNKSAPACCVSSVTVLQQLLCLCPVVRLHRLRLVQTGQLSVSFTDTVLMYCTHDTRSNRNTQQQLPQLQLTCWTGTYYVPVWRHVQ